MKRFKPSAKPCVNCRKIKSAHKRVLGVLLCPKLLSRASPDQALSTIVYLPMEEYTAKLEKLGAQFDASQKQLQEISAQCLQST